MNKTLSVIYGEVADATGLSIDERTETLVGVKNGYHLTIGIKNNAYAMYASARKNGCLPDKEFTKAAKKAIEGVYSVQVHGNNIEFTIGGATKNKTIANMISVINGATEFFKANGYEDVCECCGQPSDRIKTYVVQGGISFLCDDCYAKINQTMKEAEFDAENTEESLAGGIFGALVGSILGALAIIIVAQLGYVAAYSGVIMGFCTIYGYEKLGKKLTTRGIVISSILMIAMVYVAVVANWTIALSKEFGFDFLSSLDILWSALSASNVMGDFIISLLEAYGFTALGAIPTVISIVRKRKAAFSSFEIQ